MNELFVERYQYDPQGHEEEPHLIDTFCAGYMRDLRAETERLRGHLFQYGEHHKDCGLVGHGLHKDCTCGYETMIREITIGRRNEASKDG